MAGRLGLSVVDVLGLYIGEEISAAGEQAASHGTQLVCHSGFRSFSTSVVCGSSRPRYLHLEF